MLYLRTLFVVCTVSRDVSRDPCVIVSVRAPWGAARGAGRAREGRAPPSHLSRERKAVIKQTAIEAYNRQFTSSAHSIVAGEWF